MDLLEELTKPVEPKPEPKPVEEKPEVKPDVPPTEPKTEELDVQVPADAPVDDEKPKRKRPPRIPNADVIPRKKRGKKGDDIPKVTEPQPAEFFAQQLYGIHQLAALMTGLPVEITEDDAKKLGDAVHGVVKQFDLSWIGKFTPVINLAVTVAVVEAPVIMKAQAAIAEKHAKTKPQPFKVPAVAVESGEPIKDSLTDVPEPKTQTGVFSNLSDMEGVKLKRE